MPDAPVPHPAAVARRVASDNHGAGGLIRGEETRGFDAEFHADQVRLRVVTAIDLRRLCPAPAA
jgi:hypothetical protein